MPLQSVHSAIDSSVDHENGDALMSRFVAWHVGGIDVRVAIGFPPYHRTVLEHQIDFVSEPFEQDVLNSLRGVALFCICHLPSVPALIVV